MGFAKLPEDLRRSICSFLEVVDCCRCQMVGEARLYHAADSLHLPVRLFACQLIKCACREQTKSVGFHNQ